MEHIAWFNDPDKIDENYDPFLREFFNTKIEIDSLNKEIAIPNIFETYYYDFGGTNEDILKFIWNWYENPECSLNEAVTALKSGLKLRYYALG